MASVSFVTPMFDHALWCVFATSAIMGATKADVSFAAELAFPMPSTARNAASWRRIAMAVQRLSTWDVQKQICSTSERSMASSDAEKAKFMQRRYSVDVLCAGIWLVHVMGKPV